MIYVERIPEDHYGLYKVRYGFEFTGNTLRYVEHFRFHRTTHNDKWGDEWPKALSYEDWCKLHDLEPVYCECHCRMRSQYDNYVDSMNPVCQRAANGKPIMSGQYSRMLSHLPTCPDDVAAEAENTFTKSFAVEWKNCNW